MYLRALHLGYTGVLKYRRLLCVVSHVLIIERTLVLSGTNYNAAGNRERVHDLIRIEEV